MNAAPRANETKAPISGNRQPPIAAAAACIMAALCGGCLFHPLQTPPRASQPLPDTFCRAPGERQNAGGFQPVPIPAGQKRGIRLNRHYSWEELTLTNAHDSSGRTIQIDYYLPNPEGTGPATLQRAASPPQFPAILILPIMGGSNYELETYFGRAYARHGFAVVILHRPDIKSEVHELEEIDRLLRRSVEDAQGAIDWLSAQPQIDGGRIGVFGVSLGAIRATLVLGIDPRVRAAVLGLVGGDLPYILTHTTEKGLVRERDRMLAARQMSLEQAEVKLRQLITYDPIRIAPSIDPSRVLMVIAAFDGSIPAVKGWELRRALGNPATVQLLSGHYTSVIYAPYLRWKTTRFFERKMKRGNADVR